MRPFVNQPIRERSDSNRPITKTWFKPKSQREARSELTNQELQLEVVSVGERPAEGDSDHELLAAAHHQVGGVVGGGVVVGFVLLLTHVDLLHHQTL